MSEDENNNEDDQIVPPEAQSPPSKQPKPRKDGKFAKTTPQGWEQKGLDLYLDGFSLREIAPMVGVSYAYITRYATKAKWNERRTYLTKLPKDITPESIEHLWLKKNDAVKTAIRDLVAQGKRLQTAAGLFGWTAKDIKEWMKTDETFHRRIVQAVSIFECRMTDELKNFAGKDWKPKQYLLETHEELKEVYKSNDDNKGVAIVVNLDRPVISEIPQIVASRPVNVIDNNVQDVAFVEVKSEVVELDKPLETKLPAPAPQDVAQARVQMHNEQIKRRLEQREKWWAEREAKKNGT